MVSSGHDEVEDDEAIQSHLSVLQKEGKKSRIDEGKVTRLMSLTFASRRNTMLSLTANTRVTTTLQNYPFFKKPIYVSYRDVILVGEFIMYILILVDPGHVPYHWTKISIHR